MTEEGKDVADVWEKCERLEKRMDALEEKNLILERRNAKLQREYDILALEERAQQLRLDAAEEQLKQLRAPDNAEPHEYGSENGHGSAARAAA